MKIRILSASLALGFVAAYGLGQSPPQDQQRRGAVQTLAEALEQEQMAKAKAQAQQMHEDVEVMRRLLSRTFIGVYDSPIRGEAVPGSSRDRISWLKKSNHLHTYLDVNAQFWDVHSNLHAVAHWLGGHPFSATEESFPLEGVYLKGHGVVYTVTLPVPASDPKPKASQPARKPLSEWDRTRKELRGEKVEAEAVDRDKHVPLADSVLQLLAENGHNFSHLAADERLTVAMTFRGQMWAFRDQMCMNCHAPASIWKADTDTTDREMIRRLEELRLQQKPTPDETGSPDSGKDSGTGSKPAPGAQQQAVDRGLKWLEKESEVKTTVLALKALGEATKATQAEHHNHMLLGDLHLKQGRPKEAVDAYKKAVEAYEKTREREDAEFIRRVYLDLTGTLPTATQTSEFLKDQDMQKRRKLAQTLLETLSAEGSDAAGPFKRAEQLDVQAVSSCLTAVELYNKLAQAQVAQGEVEGAQNAIKKAMLYATAAGQRDNPKSKPAATAQPVQLPSKLIISVPKKVLDQAGAGKMSFEEFKKAASVEYVTFPPGKSDSSKSSGERK